MKLWLQLSNPLGAAEKELHPLDQILDKELDSNLAKMVYTGTSAFTASIAAPPAVRASVLFRRQATSAAPIGLGFR